MYDVAGGRDFWAYGEGKPYESQPDKGCLMCKAMLKHTRYCHRYLTATLNGGTTTITPSLVSRMYLFKDWQLIASLGKENRSGSNYVKDEYDATQCLRDFPDWGVCLLCFKRIRHSFYLHREMHLKCAM
jgi:hypothetical protein